MQFKRNPEFMQSNLYALLGFYLFSLFLLAVAWEFKLEAVAMYALDLPYDSNFETAERWRFVLTAISFAILSMVVPLFLLRRLIDRLQLSYNDLLVEQAHSDSLARHDPLSGLLNRHVFHEQLATRLKQSSNLTAVFLIDIDDFKVINDTHGHAVGDAAICLVADVLREATAGWQASLARLGGDEFAFAVSGDFSRHELQRLGKTLQEKIAESATFCLPGVTLSATLSISMSPLDATAPEALMQCAKSAMCRGKKSDRAVFFFYDASFEHEYHKQERFEKELRQAVEEERIEPFYQPIVSLPEQCLVGFELLARWVHPERGIILPQDFIPLTEQLGLIKPLTESLLLQAFTLASQWPRPLTLAVNVTSSMIEHLDFPDWLERTALKGNFSLRHLEVEVTENTLVANVITARLNLERLRAMGVSVALDDFGTGYSGLYHLTRLAIDKIKIDRSFFDASLNNPSEMVTAILALGKSLRIQITAEGVEDEQLAQWLATHECNFAQGYLFGRPVPGAQVMALVAMDRSAVPLRA